jgi:uncharacterized phage-like protein YoqJ
MIIAATGHRPHKLGGYEWRVFANLDFLARKELSERKPSVIISGMALGWDMAIAKAAIDLSIPLVAACPCPQQASRWPKDTQRFWRELLGRARTVEYISPLHYPGVEKKRNEWMVDRCHEVLALYDGSGEGGTYHCMEYASRHHKPRHNVWGQYLELMNDH